MADKIFKDVKAYSEELKQKYTDLHNVYRSIEDIYLMRETEEMRNMRKANNAVAILIDPLDRIAVKGGQRIISVNVPQVNVPFDKNNAVAKASSEKIEAACSALLARSDYHASKPIHKEITFPFILFDEAIAGVNSTKDMLAAAEQNLTDATTTEDKETAGLLVEKYKQLNKDTPYLYEGHHPLTCYPEYSKMLGMRSLVIDKMVTIGEVIDTYGYRARTILGKKINPDLKRLERVRIRKFIGPYFIYDWLDEYAAEPLRDGKNDLGFLNYAGGIAEGSFLFEDLVDQREPFLMTELKSEMFKRRTEMLTAWMTTVRAVGLSPLWDWQHPDNPELDRPEIVTDDNIISYWDSTGGKMVPIRDRTLIDPGLKEAYQITRDLGEKATINEAALGIYLGSATNYSTQALLSTLGKLPIEPIREASGRLIADLLEISLRWWKKDGGKYELYNNRKGEIAGLSADDIPDNLTLEVVLDTELSNDMLQQSTVYAQLKGEFSKRWLAEKLMKVSSWDEMQNEIWSEQASEAEYMHYVENQLAQRVQEIVSRVQQSFGGQLGGQDSGQVPPQTEGAINEPTGAEAGIPREQAFGGMQGPMRPGGQGGYVNEQLP